MILKKTKTNPTWRLAEDYLLS